MIKYQKISGVNISESSGLSNVPQTSEGRAMGAVPGWAMLLDPDYVSESLNWVRNRAAPNSVSSPSSGSVVLGAFDNQQAAFHPVDGNIWNFFSSAKIDGERWSAFFIAMPESRTGTGPQRPLRSFPADDQSVSLNIGYSTTDGARVIVYEYGDSGAGVPTRLVYEGANLVSRESPTLIMVTFGVERGLSIYDGGEMVAQNTDDKRPLNQGLDPDDNVYVLQNCRGRFGMTGLLNIDLGAPENTGHRRAIEKFLMAKYDIPEGPQ